MFQENHVRWERIHHRSRARSENDHTACEFDVRETGHQRATLGTCVRRRTRGLATNRWSATDRNAPVRKRSGSECENRSLAVAARFETTPLTRDLGTGPCSSQTRTYACAVGLCRLDCGPQDVPHDVGPEVNSDSRDQAFLYVPLAHDDSDDAAQHKHFRYRDRW